MTQTKKIYVAGHRGMVGSAIVRQLQGTASFLAVTDPRHCERSEAIHHEIITRTHAELDLTNQAAVNAFFERERPDQVYLAAAKVGGIHANNTYPADFIYDNLMIQSNVIQAAHTHGVQKLLFLGSSCIYPKGVEQPMREEALLTAPLEPTNEPYAIAKIAGIKLCESINRQHGRDYRSVMPTNLYGPGDNYHPDNSHVIPGLIRRFHEARVNQAPSVLMWGTGTPRREFLYVDDMAAASIFVMNLDKAHYDANTQPMLSHINVGSGHEMTILEVAQAVARVVGYSGRIELDSSKPDGAPRKLMDSSRLSRLGWQAQVGMEQGLEQAYQDFLKSNT